MNPTVAVIAQGAMGAGVGGRLAERGLKVITSLSGRSEASAKRAAAAGMVAVSDAECAKADVFLSILPPSDALPLAEQRKLAFNLNLYRNTDTGQALFGSAGTVLLTGIFLAWIALIVWAVRRELQVRAAERSQAHTQPVEA